MLSARRFYETQTGHTQSPYSGLKDWISVYFGCDTICYLTCDLQSICMKHIFNFKNIVVLTLIVAGVDSAQTFFR